MITIIDINEKQEAYKTIKSFAERLYKGVLNKSRAKFFVDRPSSYTHGLYMSNISKRSGEKFSDFYIHYFTSRSEPVKARLYTHDMKLRSNFLKMFETTFTNPEELAEAIVKVANSLSGTNKKGVKRI